MFEYPEPDTLEGTISKNNLLDGLTGLIYEFQKRYYRYRPTVIYLNPFTLNEIRREMDKINSYFSTIDTFQGVKLKISFLQNYEVKIINEQNINNTEWI